MGKRKGRVRVETKIPFKFSRKCLLARKFKRISFKLVCFLGKIFRDNSHFREHGKASHFFAQTKVDAKICQKCHHKNVPFVLHISANFAVFLKQFKGRVITSTKVFVILEYFP